MPGRLCASLPTPLYMRLVMWQHYRAAGGKLQQKYLSQCWNKVIYNHVKHSPVAQVADAIPLPTPPNIGGWNIRKPRLHNWSVMNTWEQQHAWDKKRHRGKQALSTFAWWKKQTSSRVESAGQREGCICPLCLVYCSSEGNKFTKLGQEICNTTSRMQE